MTMEAPKQIEPKGLPDYLEVLSKSVFQPGMSWRGGEAKWPGITEAFKNFDAEAVAQFTETDVDALANDTRVIRNRRKLDATVHNAQQMVELEREHGSFKAYLGSHGDFEETVKDLRKRFKFVGDMGAYHFLYVVGEDVPSYVDWCVSRGRTPHIPG
ncbi:MAG: DNA-3-methyladenine glycosylase I [Chloroflexi bacterium]|nr:DNA-3-methyladenine glycosylase I [Chloroflexota bacterium]